MRRWFWTVMGSVMALGASGAGATTLLGQPTASVSGGGRGQAEVAVEIDSPAPTAGTVEVGMGAQVELDGELVTGPTGGEGVDPEAPDEPPASDGHRELRARLHRCLAHHHVDVDRLLAEHSPRELLRRCLAHHLCDRPGDGPSSAGDAPDARCRPSDRPVGRPDDRPEGRPSNPPVGQPDDRPVGPPATPGNPDPSIPAPGAGVDADVSVDLSLQGGLSLR